MERQRGLRVVGEVDVKRLSRFGSPAVDGRRRQLDLEQFHERSEANISVSPLMKLFQHDPKKSGINEALAWDDLTGMRLDAGKVIEARNKEIDDVRKMSVWKNIPRKAAQSRA